MHIDLTRPRLHTLCTKQLRICQNHVIDIITSTLLIRQFLIRFLNTKVGIIAVYIYFLDTKNGNLFSILNIANYVFDQKYRLLRLCTLNQMSCIPWFIKIRYELELTLFSIEWSFHLVLENFTLEQKIFFRFVRLCFNPSIIDFDDDYF